MSDARTELGRTAILVLGMHRSGTSALTRLLGHLGAALPGDSIDAHADNAMGYWVPQALVKVDDRILRTARTSWFDPRPLDLAAIPPHVAAQHRADLRSAIAESFGDARLMAIKDPRLCRLVPLMREALAPAGVACRAVLMLRHPGEIARSLHARDRSTPVYAHALWLSHMLAAERDSRGLPRVTLSYDAMLADWRAVMPRLAALLGQEGWTPDAAQAQAISGFLDRDLRHHAAPASSGLEPHVERIMAEAQAAFLALAERDDDAARARIDAAVAAWQADPRLIDDIIHDELRHRRFEELRLRDRYRPAEEEPAPAPAAAAPPAPKPAPPPRPEARPEISPSLEEEIRLVRDSGLLDVDWYRARYPDAAAGGIDPVEHYLTVGAARGYDPSPLFQTGYYARQMVRRLAAAEGESH